MGSMERQATQTRRASITTAGAGAGGGGSVIPTKGAVIPAAVGVDIGCGMDAVLTQWTAADLPASLTKLRLDIERSIPLSAGKFHPTMWGRAPVAWLDSPCD